MVAAVETMAYAGEVPWHGLGVKVEEELTPQEMLVTAGLDWTVSRQKLYLEDGTHVPGRYALVRDSDKSILSTVGPAYKPVQNKEAFGFFENFTKTGKVTMETAGSLMGGTHVWGLARMKSKFVLPGKDEVDNFLLVHQPHLHDHSMIIQLTPIRVVCWNTLNLALSMQANQAVFRMSHARHFDKDTQEEAMQLLGLIEEQADEFAEAAKLLAKKKATSEQVEEFFGEVLQFDPKKASTKKDGSIRLPRLMPLFQEALQTAPGQDIASARGTWWGAFNAVTFVIDHVDVSNDNDKRLTRAWFGPGAEKKRRALQLALAKAA